jgi:HIV Tat-specific factor 1
VGVSHTDRTLLRLFQAPAAPVLARDKKRKDKPEVDYTSNTASTSTLPATARATSKPKRAKPNPSDPSSSSSVSSSAAQPAKPPRKSTAVYITNLPLDTTREELASVFSKCGIILLTPQNTPKINMYTDEATGMFKGEALVMYYKETSVELAITVLDETELRLGSTGEGKMKVRRAEWGDNSGGGGEKKEGEEGGAAADGGEGGGKKPQKKRMTEEEKKELNRRMKRMEKLVEIRCSS